MLGRTVRQVNEAVPRCALSLRVPPSPLRSGLAQLNGERLQRRLAQVGVRAAHVAFALSEARRTPTLILLDLCTSTQMSFRNPIVQGLC
jgi:hypothetical protein